MQRNVMHRFMFILFCVSSLYCQEETENEDDLLLYPFGDRMVHINLANPLHDQPLPFRLPYFGFGYHYIWIHKDGYVTFNKGLKSYNFPVSFPSVPPNLTLEEDPSMIAIWFGQQDIPREVDEAGVYFNMVDMATEPDGDFVERIKSDLRTAMAGSVAFVPKYLLIMTWKNMTFANRRPEKPLKTNTYQMVIATNEIQTFIAFNYHWITWITHLDNYDGLKGPPVYIGFNAGNMTRAVEYVPFSQNPRVSLLTSMGYGNGLKGRYYFSVEEEVHPGACVEKELDPNLPDRLDLTTSTPYVYMLGGQVLNVTGPCLKPDSAIYCRFDTWKVRGKYMDNNIAACVVPPLMYEGYVDITVTVDDRTFYFARLYIQSPEAKKSFDVHITESHLLEETPRKYNEPTFVSIHWTPELLHWKTEAYVQISIWGYRETDSVYPSLAFLTNLNAEPVRNGLGVYRVDLNEINERHFPLLNYDYTFGFVAINLSDFTLFGPTLWSQPIPLGAFMRSQWEREFGSQWQHRFCNNWYQREQDLDRFATTVFRCPCTLKQAEVDRGRFAPHLHCSSVDKQCEPYFYGAQHCVRSSRPSVGGSGQTCCYDDHGELIQTADTMFGGRPSRSFIYGKHPFKMQMMIPTLSNWLHDVMPFFFCCKWTPYEDNSETCQMFNYWRTSQDCSSYQPPGIASVFGDPHVITFDRLNYTFNGKGEFVLATIDNPTHKLDIHGRFEQLDPRINATHLTGIAVRDNVSATVEFRARPLSARWQYHLFMIADKEYYFFWDDNMRMVNVKGATIYQPAGIRNMSHMIAMFDSGAGVEVMLSPVGSMMLHVYLPVTFLNMSKGLMGYWSRDPSDDLMSPEGHVTVRPPLKSAKEIHYNFATKWRLNERGDQIMKPSLFWHDVVSHSDFDDPNFTPIFDAYEIEGVYEREVAEKTCGTSSACRYDFIVSGDADYAKNTKECEAFSETLHQMSTEMTIRCPALPRPQNGRKSENRYWPGTVVRFVCDDGYRLVGYEVRRCRETGLWSWGIEPKCISRANYIVTTFAMAFGIFLPVLLIIWFTWFCWRREQLKERREEGPSILVTSKLTEAFPKRSFRDTVTGDKPGESEDQPQSSSGSSSSQRLESGARRPVSVSPSPDIRPLPSGGYSTSPVII